MASTSINLLASAKLLQCIINAGWFLLSQKIQSVVVSSMAILLIGLLKAGELL